MALHECAECRCDFPGDEMVPIERRIVTGGSVRTTRKNYASGRVAYDRASSESFRIEHLLVCRSCAERLAAEEVARAAEARAAARRRAVLIGTGVAAALAVLLLVLALQPKASPPAPPTGGNTAAEVPPTATPAAVSVPDPTSPSNSVSAAAEVSSPPPAAPSPGVAAASPGTEELAPTGSEDVVLTEEQAIVKALDTGQMQSWVSGGRAGEVHVQDRPGLGATCRAYYVVDAGRRSEESAVCRSDDGRWVPLS